jgi:short-subunit dehydrogenase
MKNTILVTGGTKGIGRAIIEKFAQNGYDVITCARNKADLDNLEAYFNANFENQSIECFQVDLSKKAERETFSSLLKNKNIDILVNNTGIFLQGQLHTEEESNLETMIETNLYSAYSITRAVVPAMKEKQKGSIFTICSTASEIAYPNGGSYCVSKFALLGFSKVLREELKNEGIRVVSVLPGATFTASWEGVPIPENRFMPSEDIAEMIWSCHNLSDRTVVEEIVLRPQLGDL